MVETYRKDEFVISTDQTKFDINAIHDFLSNETHWARGIPYELVEKSIRNSYSFGLYHDDKQIGLARVITDFVTLAYIGDLYILEQYRGQGLAKWLMEVIKQSPKLQNIRKWLLKTRNMHGLYTKFGFKSPEKPENFMEIAHKNMYL